MHSRYTGGCACGALRYEIDAEPVFQNHCQCVQCQKHSGTGHSSYLVFRCAGVKQTGAAGLWSENSDRGKVKTKTFCPDLRLTGFSRVCGDARSLHGLRIESG